MESQDARTQDTAQAVEAYLTLTLAAETAMGAVQRSLREHNLTTSQIAIVELLHTRGPMHHRQIGQWVSRSSGNVTTVVDNLERRNLVRRERSRRDRRCVTVHLTAEGRALAEKLLPSYHTDVARAMGGLRKDEQATLTQYCRALIRHDEENG
jgi:MarR family 2-MHQ and catechol resistance regulon transcriptional repressor